MSHDRVVDLIANSAGRIRLTIAERQYYNNSSDEENESLRYNNYPLRNMKQMYRRSENFDGCNFSKQDVSNVSALLRSISMDSSEFLAEGSLMSAQGSSLIYRVIVGYLGTIEMPKEIASNCQQTTVKQCIRKLRQEKRVPTTVLMTILPTSLSLTNTENVVLANYPAGRLNYVSNSSESNSKYFGLVTSAIYANGLMCDTVEVIPPMNDVSVSNSCHVFVIDTKIIEHKLHNNIGESFGIHCTIDQVTGYCLEFPSSSDYVVDLIKSMYTKREEKNYFKRSNIPQNVNMVRPRRRQGMRYQNRPRSENFDARRENNNSPQLSNNSEVTTTSSNSDSGIGFNNDCANISERILVVDFPRPKENDFSQACRNKHQFVGHNYTPPRPIGIIHEIPQANNMTQKNTNTETLSASNPLYETIYPQYPSTSKYQERAIDVPEQILSFARETITSAKHYLSSAHSYDNLILSNSDQKMNGKQEIQLSVDNIVELITSTKDEFAIPRPVRKVKKSSTLPSKQCMETSTKNLDQHQRTDKLTTYKLSPKVFGLPRPISMSFENLSSGLWTLQKKNTCNTSISNWNSLKAINDLDDGNRSVQYFIDGTASEPNLIKALKVRKEFFITVVRIIDSL